MEREREQERELEQEQEQEREREQELEREREQELEREQEREQELGRMTNDELERLKCEMAESELIGIDKEKDANAVAGFHAGFEAAVEIMGVEIEEYKQGADVEGREADRLREENAKLRQCCEDFRGALKLAMSIVPGICHSMDCHNHNTVDALGEPTGTRFRWKDHECICHMGKIESVLAKHSEIK